MSVSHNIFYCHRKLADEGGVGALTDTRREKPSLQNRADALTEQAVVDTLSNGQLTGSTADSNERYKWVHRTCSTRAKHKGVGRISQQISVGTYSRMARWKLYTTKRRSR